MVLVDENSTMVTLDGEDVTLPHSVMLRSDIFNSCCDPLRFTTKFLVSDLERAEADNSSVILSDLNVSNYTV